MHAQSAEAIHTLLEKLANDDHFRSQIVTHPLETLKSVGIHADPDHIPPVRNLPSKEAIKANHAVIKDKLGSQVNMALFLLAGDE